MSVVYHMLNTGHQWSQLKEPVLRNSDSVFSVSPSKLLNRHSSGQRFETLEWLRDALVILIIALKA